MSSMAERFYNSNEMVDSPPKPCVFKVGDTVKFTNSNGLEFGPYKVIGFTKPEHEENGRFIHIDSECVWFPKSPESLTLIEESA